MKQKTNSLECFIFVFALVVALFTLSVLVWGLTHDTISQRQIQNRMVAGDMPLGSHQIPVEVESDEEELPPPLTSGPPADF